MVEIRVLRLNLLKGHYIFFFYASAKMDDIKYLNCVLFTIRINLNKCYTGLSQPELQKRDGITDKSKITLLYCSFTSTVNI